LDGRANLWSTNADHELGHNLGLPHAHNTSASGCGGSPDPGEYCDSLDPMGMDSAYLWDGSAYPIAGPTPVNIQVTVGAGYGGVSRIKLGWIPTARQQNFQRVATPTTETVDLAALDRPEAAGALVATVQTTSDENDYYVIELRTKAGRWDKALATDGVAVRHQMINPSYPTKGYVGYLAVTATRPLGLFLAGDSIVLGGVTVNVVSLDAANGRARVTITH
jgi:hypothetical protein